MFFLQDKYFFLTQNFQIIGDCSSEEILYIHHDDNVLLKNCAFGLCQGSLRSVVEQRLQMLPDASSAGSGPETTCWLWWHQDGQHNWALLWCLLTSAIGVKQSKEAPGQIVFVYFYKELPERIASVRFQVIQKFSNITPMNRKKTQKASLK